MNGLFKEIARSMIVGVSGTELTDEEKGLFEKYPPAGVVIFFRNVSGLEQLERLTSEIHITIESSSGLPPIVCADHEGGRVSVLAHALGVPPSQMALGRTLDHSLCRDVFLETARRARLSGVNTLLSPVADVNSNIENPVIGTRSFGETVDTVERFTTTAMDAMASGGVASCVKHFPGHGSSSEDSHVTLPCIGKSRTEMEDFEIVPFRQAVSFGVPIVMVGHLAVGEKNKAASMDREVIEGWLRGGLGFKGVVITDALEMKGALAPFVKAGTDGTLSLDDPALFLSQLVGFFSSGIDILLYSEPACVVYERLMRSLETGGRDVTYLVESVLPARSNSSERIERLRKLVGSLGLGMVGGRESGESCDSSGRRSGVGTGGNIGCGGKDIGLRELRVPDSYSRTARTVLESQDDLRMLGDACRGAGVLVLGEEKEFFNPVVKNFVDKFCRKMGVSGEAGMMDHTCLTRSFPDGVLEIMPPLREGTLRECGNPGSITRFRFNGKSGGTIYILLSSGGVDRDRRVLLLVNRAPLDADLLEALVNRETFVVAAGWPYVASIVPAGTPFVVTYDVYHGILSALFEG